MNSTAVAFTPASHPLRAQHMDIQVPGSTSVGTYLQESLGFLSQPQHGDWPSSAEGGAAAMRSPGPSLGISFLSGVCSTWGGGVGEVGGVGGTVMDMDTATAGGERPRGMMTIIPIFSTTKSNVLWICFFKCGHCLRPTVNCLRCFFA